MVYCIVAPQLCTIDFLSVAYMNFLNRKKIFPFRLILAGFDFFPPAAAGVESDDDDDADVDGIGRPA